MYLLLETIESQVDQFFIQNIYIIYIIQNNLPIEQFPVLQGSTIDICHIHTYPYFFLV